MARYVDGFVIPIPERNVAAYRAMARRACRLWMKHGALDYVEAVGDDLAVPPGAKMRGFGKAAAVQPGETVVFAWITYKSRRHRDTVNRKVMADPWMAKMVQGGAMPFDGRRMAMGGFRTIVAAGTSKG